MSIVHKILLEATNFEVFKVIADNYPDAKIVEYNPDKNSTGVKVLRGGAFIAIQTLIFL